MDQNAIIGALETYRSELNDILGRYEKSDSGWHIHDGDESRFREIVHEVQDLLRDHIEEGDKHAAQLIVYANESISNWLRSPSYGGVDRVKGLVASVLARVRRNPMAVRTVAQAARAAGKRNPEFIERLAVRLPTIIRDLRARREDRSTLDVNDEYDLQDLLRCLLGIELDDVRREEWTPSYAGAASRMDFLLPEVEAVVETKMARSGYTAKRLGDELIVDVARYERHPQCKMLYCIVYDPEGRIANPRGIESDLAQCSQKITVRLIIVPR